MTIGTIPVEENGCGALYKENETSGHSRRVCEA